MLERSIFMQALDCQTVAERSALLDGACAHNPALRQRVEALLRSHTSAGSFLGQPVPERLAEKLQLPAGMEETQPPQPDEDDDGRSLEFLVPSDSPGSLGKLGHYEVQEVIGHGGMGIVLRAFDERLHRVVAIKVMAAQLATSATARKRFIREARAAAAISHDHIVTIHAVEEANGLPYIAMHYVAGQSLQQRLDHNGPLELSEILRIGMQTAAGLAAAHAQGLIHRDIKPANILLENGVERVKITDFGLARAAADASMTQTGTTAGTPQYMAPEQARGETLDARTDLFALGSVLYAMCTGRSPFRGSNTLAVLKRVCEETPSPIRETNPAIPDFLVAIVNKLQAKNPAERYQSAAEVAEVLNGHLAQLQQPSAVGQAPAPVGNALRSTAMLAAGCAKSRSRRPLWTAAAAALLCVLVLLGLSEAGGVTKLTTSVIRVLTPQGTLIIEVDDPGVKVTVEGDGGLIITGAGPQEVRVPAGKYTVRATKDGQPVKEEVVSIIRGGEQTVRVLRETPATTAMVPASGSAPFVLVGAADSAERKFEILSQAVLAASDGDTIEIRGNGPFVTRPTKAGKTSLTIRAGQGFRPVIRLDMKDIHEGEALLETNSTLRLEGVDVLATGQPPPGVGPWWPVLLHALGSDARLLVVNCRFVAHEMKGAPIRAADVAVLDVRNCQFATPGSVVYSPARESRFVFQNNVTVPDVFGLCPDLFHPEGRDVAIELEHNTLVAPIVAQFYLERLPAVVAEKSSQEGKAVRIRATGNLFGAVHSVLRFEQSSGFVQRNKQLPVSEMETLLRATVDWRGERNGFPAAARLFDPAAEGSHVAPTQPSKTVADWDAFWGSAEVGSVQGQIRYAGGNLHERAKTSPESITPDDFRLREGSAGYRAGADGKDLGADVNLVGPGPAYERWKKTPQYQDWLKETGQAGPAAKIDDVLKRGNEHVARGDLDQAAQEFSLALSLVAEPSAYGTERLQIVGQFVSSDELFERVVKLRANDVNLWGHRAFHLAKVGRFEESSACYQKRLELGPDGAGLWHLYSLALIARNDEAAYRSLCEEMLVAFVHHTDPMELANVAMALVIVPDSVKDKQRAFGLAERAVNGAPDKIGEIGLAYAAWLYRLDRLDEALGELDKEKKRDYQGFSLCFLAMAHHRLGHAEEARQHANAARKKKSATSEATAWFDRVRLERLIVEMDSILAAEPDKAHAPEAEGTKPPATRDDGATGAPPSTDGSTGTPDDAKD